MDTGELSKDDMHRQERLRQWETLVEEFSHMVDGLGKPIDRGIFDTVVGLNALGIKTRQSCEGHPDWGEAFPWIDFNLGDLDGYKDLESQYSEAWDRLEQAEESQKSSQEIEHLAKERLRIQNMMDRIKAEFITKIQQLFDKFYADRLTKIPYDQILIYAGGRIKNIGAETQILKDSLSKESDLHRYQEEMNQFAQFLKEHFLSS